MSAQDARAQALELWRSGFARHRRGDLRAAVELYQRAIEIDPNFGNPYNDIGVYLIEKGALDDAVPWLERAKRAPRYEPRHFPYLNLGRVYMAKGDLSQALREFSEALEMHPNDGPGARMERDVGERFLGDAEARRLDVGSRASGGRTEKSTRLPVRCARPRPASPPPWSGRSCAPLSGSSGWRQGPGRSGHAAPARATGVPSPELPGGRGDDPARSLDHFHPLHHPLGRAR